MNNVPILYGLNGEFHTEVLKRKLKNYTFKNAGTDFNLDWLQSNYKTKIPAIIVNDKVLNNDEINNLINGYNSDSEVEIKPKRKTKRDQ